MLTHMKAYSMWIFKADSMHTLKLHYIKVAFYTDKKVCYIQKFVIEVYSQCYCESIVNYFSKNNIL